MNRSEVKDIPSLVIGNDNICCHICKGMALKLVEGYKQFPQVTSDCKLWRSKSILCVCETCGSVQKEIDRKWQKEVKTIYADYTIYHQSSGTEQAVFDRYSGKVFTRSERVLKYVKRKIRLPVSGRYLDLGCGNGGALRSFAKLLPRWTLAGAELNDKHKNDIEIISEKTSFYTCDLKNITGIFDIITLFHVLEHIIDPAVFLAEVKAKLAKGGFLVIDVPDYRQNPFDLFVADHATHFTDNTLKWLLDGAGFETVKITADLIQKEIVLIVRKCKARRKQAVVSTDHPDGIAAYYSLVQCFKWARAFLEKTKEIACMDNFGIFGTSIIATWLLGVAGKSVNFFVDEDPGRHGKTYMGRPVYHPRDIPKGSNVFLALPSVVACSVHNRLSRKGVNYYLPPPAEEYKLITRRKITEPIKWRD